MQAKTHPKYTLLQLIDMMRLEQKAVCGRVYQDYKQIIDTIPGSSTKHQAWEGGYTAHIEEAMNIAVFMYEAMDARRKLDFELSDALFCLYFHDFDKVQRYEIVDGELVSRGGYDSAYVEKTAEILKNDYDYTLTPEQFNALKYAHGEGKDYHPTDRVILPLGTLVHCADIISARIWYDNGRTSDSWSE